MSELENTSDTEYKILMDVLGFLREIELYQVMEIRMVDDKTKRVSTLVKKQKKNIYLIRS